MRRIVLKPVSCGINCICQFCRTGSDLTCVECDQLNGVRMDKHGNRRMSVSVDRATGVAVLED
jgi:hypothetical protein